MKFWWLKRYKELKIGDIDKLIRDVNYYIVMPKNYLTRYSIIKEIDINKLDEEDLLIFLYSLLNHDKIKNNKILLIINKLLEIPDNSLPATNYSLEEMLDEINNLKNNYPISEKLASNNIAACYHCLNVFYVDNIKYINKKGYCLCPYCKSHNLYFDNDFIPMDYNFLRLAKIYFDYTTLGCNFRNIQNLLKREVKVVNGNILDMINDSSIFIINSTSSIDKNNIYKLDEFNLKKEITSHEEMVVSYKFNEIFNEIATNMNSCIYIDLSILKNDNRYQLSLSLILNIMENLGRNPYLKNIYLCTLDNKDYKIIKEFLTIIEKYR